MRGCCARCCGRAGSRSRRSPRPTCWSLVRWLGCLRVDGQRRASQQRVRAQLFHQGCPPIRALLSQLGRDGVATGDCRRRVDATSGQRCGVSMNSPTRSSHCEHDWSALPSGDRVAGTSAPLRRGPVMCGDRRAKLGDVRRFHSSDQVVACRFDVTVCSSDGERSPGHCPTRIACAAISSLRGGQAAARAGSPDYTCCRRSPNGPATGDDAAARTPHWRWNVSCCAVLSHPAWTRRGRPGPPAPERQAA